MHCLISHPSPNVFVYLFPGMVTSDSDKLLCLFLKLVRVCQDYYCVIHAWS